MIVERISKMSGLHPTIIYNFANSASFRYKRYFIKKRNGGEREIFHPSKELKSIQRILNELVFKNLPVHSAAKAYRLNTSVKDNALPHLNNKFLLRLDFKNFFPSITFKEIESYLSNQFLIELTPDDISFIGAVVLRHGKLTIGAPSSPILSNVLLYDFDQKLTTKLVGVGITYTRYADDLIFSTNAPNLLDKVQGTVVATLKECGLPFQIHTEKTIFTSKKRTRSVTGIVLSSENKLSVGRMKKRIIKAQVHKFILGQLQQSEIASLKGMISYVASIEKFFIDSLISKYGVDVQKLFVR